MGGDTFKKAAQLTNPYGWAMMATEQVTGQDIAPKIKYKGAEMSLTGNPVYDGAAAAKTL